MKSIDFIRTRKDIWIALEESAKSFDRLTQGLHRDKNIVSFMQNYRRTSADLSLTRSLFPNDSLIPQLNSLIIKALSIINANQQSDLTRIKYFFMERLPQLVIRLRYLFIVSSLIFILSAMAGYFLTMLNPYAAHAIVGDHYIYMTLSNIEKGKPFAVYQSGLHYIMSSFIMANNLKVAFVCFGLGALYGVGTFMILLFNGLMLGAITAVFAQHNLSFDFATTVLIHGTLELFSIMVAGTAGLRLGQSLFRPGTLSRLDALYRFGTEAFHIAFFMVPVIAIAALLEGFVTPLAPARWLRITIISASVAFLFVYILLPTILYIKRKKSSGETFEPAIKFTF